MTTLSIRLTADQARRIRQRAAARGVDVEAYLADLAERDLADAAWETAAADVAAALAGRPRPTPAPARDTFYDEA